MAVGARVLVFRAVELQRGDVAGRTANGGSEAIAALRVNRVGRSGCSDRNGSNRGRPREEEGKKNGKDHPGQFGTEVCCFSRPWRYDHEIGATDQP